MKIMFDFQNMIGGAPRSQLAHLMAMQQAGHEVMATIGKDADILREKVGGVKVVNIDRFSVKKPLKNISLLKQWVQIVRSEKPDLIHANRITQFLFLAVVSDLTGVPLMFAQAGGVANVHNLTSMYGKTPICYSLENKFAFIRAGFRADDIHVIANRIPALRTKSDRCSPNSPIKILFTGNIKKVTVQGLLGLLRLIGSRAAHFQVPFLLQLAGHDITPGRIYHGHVAEQIARVNTALGEKGHVEHLGWVEDIELLQASADICIGKGRSVVQPAMAGKISFVISESGRLTHVTRETFERLFEFNFSGRGEQIDSNTDFLRLLGERVGFAELSAEAKNVAPVVRKAYLAEGATEKLEYAYKQALGTQPSGPRRIKAVKRFMQIYLGWARSKMHG